MTDENHPLSARTVAGWFLDTHQDIDPKHLDALTDLVRRARNDVAAPQDGKPSRYFVSPYTDGPSTRWNVIDRRTQEWVQRFPTEDDADADVLVRLVMDDLVERGLKRTEARAAAQSVIGIVRRHVAAVAPVPAQDPVLTGIAEALESRGYADMTNGRDIGALLDELERLRAQVPEQTSSVLRP